MLLVVTVAVHILYQRRKENYVEARTQFLQSSVNVLYLHGLLVLYLSTKAY